MTWTPWSKAVANKSARPWLSSRHCTSLCPGHRPAKSVSQKFSLIISKALAEWNHVKPLHKTYVMFSVVSQSVTIVQLDSAKILWIEVASSNFPPQIPMGPPPRQAQRPRHWLWWKDPRCQQRWRRQQKQSKSPHFRGFNSAAATWKKL